MDDLPPRRVHSIDVLRGFALCGITVVNTWQHTTAHPAGPTVFDDAIGTFLQGRFYPIFSLLFGVSFVLFLRSARRRTTRPRRAMLRRLAVLALLGLAHRQIYPGEVLLPYAAYGLVVLLPASFLPRAAVLSAGVIGTPLVLALDSDPYLLIAGLFLIGAAAAEYGLVDRLDRLPATPLLIVAVVGALAGLPPAILDLGSGLVWVDYAAGVVGGVVYCAAVLLLLRTPARRALTAVLEPLGRIALTAYLTATLAILAALPILEADPTGIGFVAVPAVILAVQTVFARLWLRRFRHGPLEWVWHLFAWGVARGPVPKAVAAPVSENGGLAADWSGDAHRPLPDHAQRRAEDQPGTGP
ncbi:DUF418 domain-containing protein [Rhizohabitans arisaemae]|uniref:DUF418 domain-containing protein n=1 Tax=Rhizohabitans arisaemae TaxID=2720610 RepID=UPI0024B0B8D1|nr:DUF418 domain-containing protein [Rhizohabitans arisaemae]